MQDKNGMRIKLNGRVALAADRPLSIGTLPKGTRCQVLEIYHAKGEPKTWLREDVDPGRSPAIPSSMAGISVGAILSVGIGDGQESVTVLEVDGAMFYAEFNKPHEARTKVLITNGLTLEVTWPPGKEGLTHTFPARMEEVEVKGSV